MKHYRHYAPGEIPRVGDVILWINNCPYGSAIITRIDDGNVTLERVHVSVSFGQAQIGVERTNMPLSSVMKRLVFVRGPSGHIDNRKRR